MRLCYIIRKSVGATLLSADGNKKQEEKCSNVQNGRKKEESARG